MNGSRAVELGRVFGIRFGFDYSWLFIFVLMTWSLASAFVGWHPDWRPATAVTTAIVASILFFASVLLHELAHSLVARTFGVPVESITLFLFGGVSNIEREPPSPKAEFWTAIVGPLTSIALGVLLLLLATVATGAPSASGADQTAFLRGLGPVQTLLLWLGPINIIVGVFNLLPGFPLDGGRILRSALWAATKSLHTATRWASALGQAIGWMFVLLGVAIAFGTYVPFFGRGVGAGLWLAFIGWFLSSAAAQTWRRQLVNELLEGLSVSRLMRPARATVPPTLGLSQFVDDWLLRSDERSFPVSSDDGKLLGVVTLADVRRAPREAWPTSQVGRVMTPTSQLVTTSPREEAVQAFDRMMRADVSQLPVVDRDEKLVGVLLRRDVIRWIELHMSQQSAQRYAH